MYAEKSRKMRVQSPQGRLVKFIILSTKGVLYMPYRKETCRAGKTKQYTYYYSIRADKREGSRKQKENKTSEAQKKVNSRQAVKKLTWILNANYDGSSQYVTFSYEKDRRPETPADLRKDVDKLLRGLRREQKKAGKVAKIVWVPEVGERGATHVHMCINEIDTKILKKLWDKGWITIKPMDDSGQYSRLANYFVKYSEKTMKTAEGFGGRRYYSSKNLIIPEPEKQTVRSRDAYSHTIQVPSGWYLDKDSIREAWHEYTGFMYFTYTLIKDGSRRKTKQKDTYALNLDTGEIEITENMQAERRKRKL